MRPAVVVLLLLLANALVSPSKVTSPPPDQRPPTHDGREIHLRLTDAAGSADLQDDVRSRGDVRPPPERS